MSSSSATGPLLPLPPGEVHLWITEPEQITEPRLLDGYRRLLSPEERDKHLKFYFAKHRHEYLVSHALLRITLSRYAPMAPEDWTFTTNAYGRPEVVGEGSPRLRFNLSHTAGMTVVAVMSDADVGVDVEDTERSGETVGVADRFFAPAEASELRALPEARQRERFFEYWTLKEAYIKARGMGLSLPLEQFAFELRAGESPRIFFDPRLQDEPESWRFFQLRPSARHMVALAVRWPRQLPLEVRCHRTVPDASRR
jgi:4'-phosphopantetheinyl transferase